MCHEYTTKHWRLLSTFLRFWPQLDMLQDFYGPGPLMIWKNFWSQICSRTIFEMHCAPGAVCISNIILEHIWLQKFFETINGKSPKNFLLRTNLLSLLLMTNPCISRSEMYERECWQYKITNKLLPPCRGEIHGRQLRNNAKLSQPRAGTKFYRYACSPIPYYVELINSKLP